MNRKTYTHAELMEMYEACRLADQGVSIEQYFADPMGTLRAHGQEAAPESMEQGYLPLLPKQVEAMRAIWAQWAEEDRAARRAAAVAGKTEVAH